MAFTEGVWKAHLGELAPENSRGAVYEAFNAVIGFAALPASLIAGWGWERFGHGTPFVFGAVMALVAFLVFGIRVKPRPVMQR